MSNADNAPTPSPVEARADGVREAAISLFHAFAAGVGYRDVSDHKMTREKADAWIKDSVADFTATLDRLAALESTPAQPGETLWCESCGEAPVEVRHDYAGLCRGCSKESAE